MGATPQFAATIQNQSAKATAALTGTRATPTSNQVEIWSSSADAGTRVERVEFKATDSTSAGTLCLYLEYGGTYYLIEDIPVAAVTASSSVPPWSGASGLITPATPLFLAKGWKLRFGPVPGYTMTSLEFHALVQGMSY